MSKIEYFETYDKFLLRPDKSTNGTPIREDEKEESTNKGCWNTPYCTNCAYCENCTNCANCTNCNDCVWCNDCINCTSCNFCQSCINCTKCEDCTCCSCTYGVKLYTYCRKLPENARSACFIGLYSYVCIPRIYKDGTQWIQMGCKLLPREDWEKDPWNNPNEFPNDNSPHSNARMFALEIAMMWLDKASKESAEKAS